MNTIPLFILFLLSIIPILIVGYLFYKKDTIKEPKRLLGYLFFSGIISCLVVVIISIFGLKFYPNILKLNRIRNIYSLIIYAYIFVALVEETCKLLMIYFVSYNNKEFDQAYDIILYSIFVGLGFAFSETIVYLINNPSIQTIILRAITALPAHICFQIIMGYYLYLSKIKEKNKNIFLSIIAPVLLHGTYDFLVFKGSSILLFVDLSLLVCLSFFCNQKIKELIEIDKKKLKPFCPQCGTKINQKYCPNCGYKK